MRCRPWSGAGRALFLARLACDCLAALWSIKRPLLHLRASTTTSLPIQRPPAIHQGLTRLVRKIELPRQTQLYNLRQILRLPSLCAHRRRSRQLLRPRHIESLRVLLAKQALPILIIIIHELALQTTLYLAGLAPLEFRALYLLLRIGIAKYLYLWFG